MLVWDFWVTFLDICDFCFNSVFKARLLGDSAMVYVDSSEYSRVFLGDFL